MSFIAATLCFAISVVGQSAIIWVATKLVRLDCTFREAAIVATICSFQLLLPKVGFVLAAIAFFTLLIKWLDEDVTEAILLSVVTCLLQMLLLWMTLG
ncbi:MAG: hypothetical protein J0M24_03390 [Verrucomicrobia bacterium]|nr:hypothetical protein [Verrucomicrobiota bacterium]